MPEVQETSDGADSDAQALRAVVIAAFSNVGKPATRSVSAAEDLRRGQA